MSLTEDRAERYRAESHQQTPLQRAVIGGVTVYQADPLPQVIAERHVPIWLVEDLLQDDTLDVIVGPEGCGKSFITIDLAMCISHGLSYHGKRTEQRRCLYIAGEGRAGVVRRMRGWLQYHGIDATSELYVGRTQIELMSGASVGAVCEWIHATGMHPVIFIDTVSRNYGQGDESKTGDMAQVIANIDKALREAGATVVLVHHSPIESSNGGRLRTRGSSTLPAAADCILGVVYDENSKITTLVPQKAKDAPLAQPLQFRRHIEDLGDRDNFGRAVTTCVMVKTDEKPADKPKRGAPLGKHQAKAMEYLVAAGAPVDFPVLRKFLEDSGTQRRRTYEVIDSLERAGMIANRVGVLHVLHAG